MSCHCSKDFFLLLQTHWNLIWAKSISSSQNLKKETIPVSQTLLNSQILPGNTHCNSHPLLYGLLIQQSQEVKGTLYHCLLLKLKSESSVFLLAARKTKRSLEHLAKPFRLTSHCEPALQSHTSSLVSSRQLRSHYRWCDISPLYCLTAHTNTLFKVRESFIEHLLEKA